MASELGLQTLTQDLVQSQQMNPNHHQLDDRLTSGLWMRNPMRGEEDEDSWEVRAFAEDTGNIMGTTWPPRSYTCSFCRREFKSAQALGGHMNVHRRDRARLHQAPANTINPTSSSTSASFIIPTQEYVANGGLCLLYQLPNPNGGFSPTTLNACIQSPSLLSISPYPPKNFKSSCSPSSGLNISVTQPSEDGSSQYPGKVEPATSIVYAQDHEELDLELRLGHGRPR